MIAIRPTSGEFRSNSKLRVIYGDLRDAKLWARLPKSITHVFHLAAVIPKTAKKGESEELMRDNLLPIAQLIEQSAHWPNLKQVVYSSSVSVYGRAEGRVTEKIKPAPLNAYGFSKLIGEQLLGCLEARGVSVVSLRYTSLYGPEMSPHTVLPIMAKQAARKKLIQIWGRGKRTQDFLSCLDAAKANLLALRKNASGVYNIGSGSPISMVKLAQLVDRVYAQGKSRIVFKPGETESASGVQMNISKARKELGYSAAYSIEKGLRWLKQETNGRVV